MTASRVLAASAAVGGLMVLGVSGPAAAQSSRTTASPVVGYVASLDPGVILGVVADHAGEPLSGVMVSVLGATTAFCFSDGDGRFELSALPPGPYLLRAHARGYQAPRAQMVDVGSGSRIESAIALRQTGEAVVLAAGVGVGVADAAQDLAPTPPRTDQPIDIGHDDHDEVAWRIRQTRRGVLRSAAWPGGWLAADADAETTGLFGSPEAFGGRAPARVTAALVADPVFSGQVNLLTSGIFNRPDQLFAGDNFSRGIAHVRVGAPVGDRGDWTVGGALTQADVSSWILAGSYVARPSRPHQFDVGLSYSTQRYDGGNPLALRGIAEGSRNAGSVHAFDTFALNPTTTVTYGGRYARYDYLDRRALVSPRLEVTVTPVEGYRFRFSAGRRAHAPGAEEFLPPSDTGIWLPPQRTFSSLQPDQPLQAEHTSHVTVSVEQDFGDSTFSVRGFRQDIADQLVTVFGASQPGQPAATLGHYLVGNAGDFVAVGLVAELRTSWANRVHGTIAYSLTHARLEPGSELQYLVLVAPSAIRPESERIHDVSTTLEADLPETATRILVVYRASNAFARSLTASDTEGRRPAFDSRYDVQVRQSLPFMSFSNAKWEMLLAVRNFFRETVPHQSIYDELLVVRPPTRVVGGVTMHF